MLGREFGCGVGDKSDMVYAHSFKQLLARLCGLSFAAFALLGASPHGPVHPPGGVHPPVTLAAPPHGIVPPPSQPIAQPPRNAPPPIVPVRQSGNPSVSTPVIAPPRSIAAPPGNAPPPIVPVREPNHPPR
ncbi:MAG: hypothetical protein JO104_12045 [Candidatus Eremiobacteraeota bacterium]|nr:hypothetical protein [Candidatus Eremiobacteraeota bacterium]